MYVCACANDQFPVRRFSAVQLAYKYYPLTLEVGLFSTNSVFAVERVFPLAKWEEGRDVAVAAVDTIARLMYVMDLGLSITVSPSWAWLLACTALLLDWIG